MTDTPSPPVGFDDALRQLYMLAVTPDLSFDEKVAKLLALGTKALGLELGIVSEIAEPLYECLYVHGPDWAPAPGTTFDVSGTYCLQTLKADAVTAYYHAGKQDIAAHPCYKNFGLESYIGAPLMRGETRFGTLNFSATAPREAPFSAAQIEFVDFLARWLGNELTHQAERRELREQRGLLSAIVNAVPDAVILADTNRRVVLVNSSVETLFGFTPEQILGRQTAILYSSLDSYERVGKENFDPAQNRERHEMIISCRRIDGSTFEGHLATAPVITDRGEHLGFLGVVRDVSQQQEYERAKDQLIATVSHEMKTPLTALTGALKLMGAAQDALPPTQRKLQRVALRNAQAIQNMVGDILDVEQLRTQDQSGFVGSRLAPLLTQAAETMAPYAKERDVTLRLELSEGPAPYLNLHEGRVLRLLSNLLSNAIKASTEGAQVRLGLSPDGTGFWVADEGAGLPLELQPVLFERFSRGSNYRVEEGHGLGMSIVKAIVDQHLGKISFDTAEGKGTTFHVDFPAPQAHARSRKAS